MAVGRCTWGGWGGSGGAVTGVDFVRLLYVTSWNPSESREMQRRGCGSCLTLQLTLMVEPMDVLSLPMMGALLSVVVCVENWC